MAEIIGTDRRDDLEGGSEADTIYGLADNDTLYGGDGADTLYGGTGDDLYYIDSLEDTLIELPGEGNDTVSSSVSYALGDDLNNLILTGGAAINGTGNALTNILTGNDAANILTGGDGNDDLFGNGGNDTLSGGAGQDKLAGGGGDDYYLVTDSEDNVVDDPNGGNDTVYATINFNLDKSHVETLILAEGSAAVNGFGNELDNTLLGNSYDNTLGGGEGDDIIDGGTGADDMRGGLGDDTFYVDNIGDVVSDSTDGNEGGIDTVYSMVNFTLSQEVDNLVLVGEDAVYGTGNQSKNELTGNAEDNVLDGKGGDDVLDGGIGADTLIGGDGDDSFHVDDLGDEVVENQNEGIDTVFSEVDFALGTNVENLTLLEGGLTGTGNSGANVMTSSTDTDTLAGLAGNDTYHVQNDADVVIEQYGEGTDTVFSEAVNYILSANIENLTLIGSAANGTGNALDNTITGNSGANILDGAGGNDTLSGGAGNDIYYVDSSGDTVIEGSGQGTDTVKSTISYKLVIEAENLTLLGSGDIDGTGNALANTLIGNAGDNVLIAGSGKEKALDTLNGGLGSDTLYGGKSKGDVFVFDTALGSDNIDTLADFKKDYISLDADIFTSLSAGSLDAGSFVSGNGAVALDSDDYIVHDTSTGLLYYDADGSGAGAAVAFAEVSVKLAAANFTVFDSGS